MPKVIYSILVSLLFFLFISANPVQAVGSCPGVATMPTIPNVYTNTPFNIQIAFDPSTVRYDWDYYVYISDNGRVAADSQESAHVKVPRPNPVVNFEFKEGVHRNSQYSVSLKHAEGTPIVSHVCDLGVLNAFSKPFSQVKNCIINMPSNIEFHTSTTVKADTPLVSGISYNFYIWKESDATNIPRDNQVHTVSKLDGNAIQSLLKVSSFHKDRITSPTDSISIPNNLGMEKYIAAIVADQDEVTSHNVFFCALHTFGISNNPTSSPTTNTPITPPGAPGPGGIPTGGTSPGCTPGKDCTSAAGKPCPDGKSGIDTAIGCVPTEPQPLIQAILRLSGGIAGGIAFLMMIIGAFQMITSAGNPDSLKAGQQRFTSAIEGLLFVIFAVLLLQIIGVDILNIPGFSR